MGGSMGIELFQLKKKKKNLGYVIQLQNSCLEYDTWIKKC